MTPRGLLRLYPPAWRERYGDEFVALLEKEGTGRRVVLSVLAGALDAWMAPRTWLRDPVATDAYTLRVWRIQLPPETRTWNEKLRDLALVVITVVVLFLIVQLVEQLLNHGEPNRFLRLAPSPLAIAIVDTRHRCAGYSLRTKAVAIAMMSGVGYMVLGFVSGVFP